MRNRGKYGRNPSTGEKCQKAGREYRTFRLGQKKEKLETKNGKRRDSGGAPDIV